MFNSVVNEMKWNKIDFKVLEDEKANDIESTIMRCMPMLHNGLQVDFKCTQMTLAISMLNNIFLMHTKLWTHDT